MRELTLDVFTSASIRQMASMLYTVSGPNQLPHICRVVRDMQMLCRRLEIPYTWDLEAAAALHDCAKGRPDYVKYPDHGAASAAMAAEILRHAKQLPVDRVAVCRAIANHCLVKCQPVPGIDALLRAADEGAPDAGRYARKSVAWCLRRGMTREEAFANAFHRIINRMFILGRSDAKVGFAEYELGWAKEIGAANAVADDLARTARAEIVERLIAEYESSADALPADC